MTYFVVDAAPILKVGNVEDYVEYHGKMGENSQQVAHNDGWTTYLTKKKQLLFDVKDMSQTEVIEWKHDKNIVVALNNIEKLNPGDSYSFTSELVFKAGMGRHKANGKAREITMQPGDEVIFIEWNRTPVLSWFNPDDTGIWYHHIKNLRK